MKSYGFGRLASGMLLLTLGTFSLSMAATNGYHLLKKYSFGAAEGSTREYFDYITIDSAARRVYLSHGTGVKVIDADSGSLVRHNTGLEQDHGVAVATEVWPRGHHRWGPGQGKTFVL